jgi:hypothetical protein
MVPEMTSSAGRSPIMSLAMMAASPCRVARTAMAIRSGSSLSISPLSIAPAISADGAANARSFAARSSGRSGLSLRANIRASKAGCSTAKPT